MALFTGFTSALGSSSPRQVAGRHAHLIYQNLASTSVKENEDFWVNGCRMPPTFQSWFNVTNLHVWMLTVRFRALPPPIGTYYVQALVDHFFIDVEDGIRKALSKRAPERIVSRNLKDFRDQWAGLGLALDYALSISSTSPTLLTGRDVGDAEIAAAVWRNFLGARGAQGIDDPGRLRRAVNTTLAATNPKVENVPFIEGVDDGSGVHDFTGEEVAHYVLYPSLMCTLTSYIRRELHRLQEITDEEIMAGSGVGEFGPLIISPSLKGVQSK